MSKYNSYLNILGGLTLAACLTANVAHADSLSLVTSVGGQQATDSISWAKPGGDQTVLGASFNIATAKGKTAGVQLNGPNSVLSVVCAASACSWTGAGATAGHTLLWTSDAGNGGNGPVKLTFPSALAGAGAVIQADGPGKFTAQIQAFHGSTSLGSFTVVSTAGEPVYIGVLDHTGANITSVVFSLSSVAQGLTSDFALDTVELTGGAAAGGPVLSLTPTSLAFGSQQIGVPGKSQQLTLKNTSGAKAVIGTIAVHGDYGQTHTCGSSLAAGASCTITVSFHPTAAGVRSGTATVTSNATNGELTATLTGTGTRK